MTTNTETELNLPDNYQFSDMGNINMASINEAPVNVSSETTTKFNEGVEQIISNIKNMQTNEMQLYVSLDNQNLTADQRTDIINRIEQIGQTRQTLYNSLNNMASSYQQNVTTSQNTIQQQMFAIDIVENELTEAKGRAKALENQKYDKLRLVEINTYYGKRFSAHKEIVKVIVYICIFMLITIILGKKEILPRNIYITLNGMIIVIGIIVIGKKIIDLSNRDNMNFDEYDWYFNKEKAPSNTGSTTASGDPWASFKSTCVGDMCCNPTQGLIYDSVNKVCVLNTSTTLQTTETDSSSSNTTDSSM
jgi:hypothetical protein